jgi:hypothetical protein
VFNCTDLSRPHSLFSPPDFAARQKARERDRERKWQRKNLGRRDRTLVQHMLLLWVFFFFRRTYPFFWFMQTTHPAPPKFLCCQLTSAQYKREPSVEVKPTWQVVEEIEFARLAKLSWEVDDPKDLLLCGAVAQYDRSIEKLTTKISRCVLLPCFLRSPP